MTRLMPMVALFCLIVLPATAEELKCDEPFIHTGPIEPGVVQWILHLEPCLRNGEVNLIISSSGGDSNGAYSAYELAILYPELRKKLKTTGVGQVASAAVVLYLIGETRLIGCNSSILIHQPSRSINSRLTADEASDIAMSLADMNEAQARIIAAETEFAFDEVMEMLQTGVRFSAEEAVEHGFAHQIVGCE